MSDSQLFKGFIIYETVQVGFDVSESFSYTWLISRFLVFENMERGSLKDHLSGNHGKIYMHCLLVLFVMNHFLIRSSEDSLELENEATNCDWHLCSSG